MYYIGLDSGSTTTKGVLFDGERLIKKVLIPTTHRPKESMEAAYAELAEGLDPSELYTVSTGYGRDLLAAADKRITEITCHGKGAAYLGQTIGEDIGMIIDIGGQDSKVICLDRDGNIVDFLMNDKCAAGTGRFIEVILKLLKTDIQQMDAYVQGHFPMKISSMCTVFAESEVISLLADSAQGGGIALGVLHSICDRTANFAKRLPVSRTVYFSGGLAQSQTMTELLQHKMGHTVITHELAQYTGAIGAAVIGSKKQGLKRF